MKKLLLSLALLTSALAENHYSQTPLAPGGPAKDAFWSTPYLYANLGVYEKRWTLPHSPLCHPVIVCRNRPSPVLFPLLLAC